MHSLMLRVPTVLINRHAYRIVLMAYIANDMFLYSGVLLQ